MERYVKFLKKLQPHLQLRLIETVDKITRGQFNGLDIKPLKGKGEFFRCRVGKIRIVFEARDDKYIVYDIGFRGDIYN